MSPDAPAPRLIAEIGSVHDGSFGNAQKLNEAAAAAGADAVKFQTHIASAETRPDAPSPGYFNAEPRHEYFTRTGFTQDQWSQLNAMNGLSVVPVQAASASPALSLNSWSAWTACRSRIWSPMATPQRNASSAPARRNTAYGRFWMGKSVPAAFAEVTQLRSAGS